MTQVYSSAISQEWAPISPEGLGQERGVLVGGGDRGYRWGLGGKVGLFSPQRQNAPSPPPPSLPSHGLCMPSAPLLPLLSPGHSALLSIHNGGSVLGLLTLHSACALGSEHGQTGGGGWYMGARNTIWRNATLPPPPTLTSLLILTKHIHTYTDGAHKTSAIRPNHGTRQKNNPKQTSVPIMPAVTLCAGMAQLERDWAWLHMCSLYLSSGAPGTGPMWNFKTCPSETLVTKLIHNVGARVCSFETIKLFHAPLTNQSKETCVCVM